MFPGRFIDGSENAKGFRLVGKVIEKMRKSAKRRNRDDAEPKK